MKPTVIQPTLTRHGRGRPAPAYVGLRGSAYPDRLRPDGRRPAAADGAELVPDGPKPPVVAGATWQSGVTARNDRYRVLLNGEPVAGAVAASAAAGWVDVARGSRAGEVRYEPDLLGEAMGEYVKRYTGAVTLVRCGAGE